MINTILIILLGITCFVAGFLIRKKTKVSKTKKYIKGLPGQCIHGKTKSVTQFGDKESMFLCLDCGQKLKGSELNG